MLQSTWRLVITGRMRMGANRCGGHEGCVPPVSHTPAGSVSKYYDKFVELWKNGDPELRPVVEDVWQRIARLVAER